LKKYTLEEIEALKTKKGGYTRKSLESLGVPWPPKKGWKKRLLADKGGSIYSTKTWKMLRYEVLCLYKSTCQLCGLSPKDGAVMQVDHIKPIHTHPWPGRLRLTCACTNEV
jgi:hypothetical protein